MLKSKLVLFCNLIIFVLLSSFHKVEHVADLSAVRIGSQVWTIKNLNVDTFRNGDPIPHARYVSDWHQAIQDETPAWCYYKNDKANGVKYGKLYNYFAVEDERGLAPEGWHVPNNDEWDELVNFLGGSEIAGKKMKAKNGWIYKGNGTNESKFSALPGGARYLEGDFKMVGDYGYFWSSTSTDNFSAYTRTLSHSLDRVGTGLYFKGIGFSVRLVKD
jgi:uncharacterized protein (TIGR02145 family)